VIRYNGNTSTRITSPESNYGPKPYTDRYDLIGSSDVRALQAEDSSISTDLGWDFLLEEYPPGSSRIAFITEGYPICTKASTLVDVPQPRSGSDGGGLVILVVSIRSIPVKTLPLNCNTDCPPQRLTRRPFFRVCDAKCSRSRSSTDRREAEQSRRQSQGSR